MAIDSAQYYDEHAEEFFEGTAYLDLSALYEPFLALVPAGGHILDAGCGSGRDTRAFVEQGYRVSAFDASAEMVARARAWSGVDVACRRFAEVDEREAYDGIWACASLLHVPRADLPDALGRLARVLRQGGVLYCSFKAGEGERAKGGRLFTDLDEQGLERLLATATLNWGKIKAIRLWRTSDLRPGRLGEEWINGVFQKSDGEEELKAQ